MKTTLKVALLASVMMATPVLAADKSDTERMTDGKNATAPVKHTVHRHHRDSAYYNQQEPAANLDDADRMNGSNSRYGHAAGSENTWLGMRSTTRGAKDGIDSDMNNRSQHSFIFGSNESHVVKH